MFRWRIRHKLAAGLILVVSMTSLLAAGSYYGLRAYQRSNRMLGYHQHQLHRLESLILAVTELYYPVRNPSENIVDQHIRSHENERRLSRIEEMLVQYETGLNNAPTDSVTNDGKQRQLREIEQMKGLVETLKAAIKRPTKVSANTPIYNNFYYVGNDRDLIAELGDSANRLMGINHDEVNARIEADRNDYRASLAIVSSASFLVLVMLFVLVWLGYRAIFYPMRELHRGVTKLAGGNFDSRVQLDSGDEMQELGEAFNNMADRLKEIYKDLNRQVEERSRQLIRSERLASVGFLAAGVAHEINNPLASIAFCGEALESRLGQLLARAGNDAEVVQNYLRMIQQEAFRCKAITEKLLDFSRAGEPERIETDLVALIRSVMEMVEHVGRNHDKNLVFEPTEMVMARVNPQELKQVLLNLVVNGLESIDPGGTVTLQARNRGSQVEIAVRDDGCGMTAEVMQNLFEPFFTRNRTGKGTGLGLSISHLIISQHGGTLDATSAGSGKGSTFTVRLPVQTEEALAAA